MYSFSATEHWCLRKVVPMHTDSKKKKKKIEIPQKILKNNNISLVLEMLQPGLHCQRIL